MPNAPSSLPIHEWKFALAIVSSLENSCIALCSSDSFPSLGTSLSDIQSRSLRNTQFLGLGDWLISFRQDHFNVAWVGHVWVDTTVGTVGATALLGGLVDLDVLDDEF